MKRRFTFDNAGSFRDRNGYELPPGVSMRSDRMLVNADGDVLGTVVGVTVLLSEVSGTIGLVCSEEGIKEEANSRGRGRRWGAGVGEIPVVWDHYCAVMQPRDETLHPAEEQIIRDALRVASADECRLAIDGNKASAFHQGDNPRGKKYNRLSHILRGKRGKRTVRESIDLFIELAENSHGMSLPDAGALTRLKRTVLQAHTYTDNKPLQERAEQALAQLRDAGWDVRENSDGRPEFVRKER